MQMKSQDQQRIQQRERPQQERAHVQYRSFNPDSMTCPHCGANVPRDNELCPECGRPLHIGVCTYCGSPMDPDDRFCPECGGSRQGVICPQCGTLNFRSYCRNCNAPLDELAVEENERARKDPVFIKMMDLGEEMAILEERMLAVAKSLAEEQVDEPIADFSHVAELSDEDKALMEQYKNMMTHLDAPTARTPDPATPVVTSKTASPKVQMKLEIGGSREELQALREEYALKLKEMGDLMNQLVPDPGSPPQIQRNYYSARKLPVYTKKLSREPVAWVCNLCGCHHNQPSECAQPQLGGVWIYKEVEITVKEYV